MILVINPQTFITALTLCQVRLCRLQYTMQEAARVHISQSLPSTWVISHSRQGSFSAAVRTEPEFQVWKNEGNERK